MAATSRAAFANTTLPLRLPLWDVTLSQQRSVMPTITEVDTFQIHGALCHRQGSPSPVEGNVPSYAQLYIYDPSYDAQRQSERNENLDNEVIENPSTLLSQWNPFARIYRHAYEILSNRESSRINREDRANSNGSTESGSSYIVISSSMRMHLIKGDDKRTHNLPTMEEVAVAIPIEYIDRNFRDIVLTLRSSSRNDSLRQ